MIQGHGVFSFFFFFWEKSWIEILEYVIDQPCSAKMLSYQHDFMRLLQIFSANAVGNYNSVETNISLQTLSCYSHPTMSFPSHTASSQ